GEDQRLLGNVSAAFSPAGGFSSGKIGSTAGGAAVLLRSGKCEPAQGERKKKKVEASGKISAVSSSSITLAGATGPVPSSLRTRVPALKVGDRVEMRGEPIKGTLTLTRVEKKREK